ncbi:M23 family metallopeptidase [Acidimangrovimonas pyrenivorans]|uniref:M23 family metallopeptidase n=1 Tax=Acidimangrovimonas pyrenivorans TaxID=2030798 RepID=A0ABV7AMQ1_9RHOB
MKLPIACTLGQTCFIQNYVDDDPGPGAEDFTCGPLTYNGHKGTDIALPSLAAMRAGVAVLAAAPGTVLALRDGMPDIAANAPDAPDISGRECGNGVLVANGDGWQTQYCHMKRGSISVRKGEKVSAGTVLGQVGLSGDTEFPHVHLSVRHDGKVVDPFAPDTARPPACGTPPTDTLWQPPIAYVPGGLVNIGFATAVPGFDAVKAGLPSPRDLPADAPALVLWAQVYGGRAGDKLGLRIVAPDGTVLVQQLVTLDRAQARLFRAIGKRSPADGWPPGPYIALVQLQRDGNTLGQQRTSVEIGQ